RRLVPAARGFARFLVLLPRPRLSRKELACPARRRELASLRGVVHRGLRPYEVLGAASGVGLSNKALELTGRGRRRANLGMRRPHWGVGSGSVSIRLAAVARYILASRAAGSSMLIRWTARNLG